MFKMLTTSLAMAAFASLAFAQNYPPASTQNAPLPTSAVSTVGVNHVVQVGFPNGTIGYTPQSILNVAVGDTITFQFNPKNHTVTQSTFTSPCAPKAGGFTSGFNPVPAGTVNGKTFTITVNDTNPIWVYCQQTGHCQDGMVFAINPTTAQPFTQYLQNALNSSSGSSSTTPSPSGDSGNSSGSATDTGATAGSTSTQKSNGITTSVIDNVGFITVLAIVGGFILAL